jgi:uncharacterized protein YegL
MVEQVPFEHEVSFAENPEPRCPCVLLLDTSGSMGGEPINELNAGLALFKDELAADELAAKRVETAVVTFGGRVQTAMDFATLDAFAAPTLVAGGETPMGAAILQACDLLESRKAQYKTNGITYYRPWIFMITDGAPTDPWSAAAERVKDGESKKKFSFYAVAVKGARMDILKQISVKSPLNLTELKFRELFQWLSTSLQSVARSTPGTEAPLPSPAGWGTVPT